ncbi:MAG: 16S rRNA (cytosine(1402)-N(4))-methyltransferase RsmH [Candidatus Neomarinimicrobiota bacterium]
MKDYHKSVLLNETIENLIMNKNGIYIDGTIGFAGHSKYILHNLSKNGKLIGIDLDSYALKYSKSNLSKFPKQSYSLYKGNFSEIPDILKNIGITKVDGIVVDLGISSYQIDSGHRGFSYMNNGDLDMRFNEDKGVSAKELLNNINENDLGKIIKLYGEEKKYKKIARNIVKYSKEDKMNTTFDLKKAIQEVTNPRYLNKTLSRVFQSIRIKVNEEIKNLNLFLENSLKCLKRGGRLVIITFHSLEDSIVKHFFKENEIECICPPSFPICNCSHKAKIKIINRKGILPTISEIEKNSRARSAKLRIAECL